jgi:hypothetical protein
MSALVVSLCPLIGGCGRSQLPSELASVQRQLEQLKSQLDIKGGEHRVLISEISTLERKQLRPAEIGEMDNKTKEVEAEIAMLRTRATEMEKLNDAVRSELEAYRAQFLKR